MHAQVDTYTHKTLEGREVSSQRMEGRKEGNEGRKELELFKLLSTEYLLWVRHDVTWPSQQPFEVGIFLFPLSEGEAESWAD